MAKKYNATETKERNRRKKYFDEVVVHFLAFEYDVSKHDDYSYCFDHEKHGKIIVYPKGDILLLTNVNKWKNEAVKWLKENIIKEKF